MGDFSLRGASFEFCGLEAERRRELASLVRSHGGEVFDAASAPAPSVVYVVTDYWANDASTRSASERPVTPFWLAEMLRLRRWLPRDAHPFFVPPLRPPKRVDVAVDDDRDVTMDGVPPYEMQLPWTCRFKNQVPVWPYFATYLARPMQTVHELTATLQLTTMTDPRRRFNCLELAVNELLTVDEQTQFFQDILPEMVKLVLDMPQMFTKPPTLLTPLEETESTTEKSRVVTQSCRLSGLEVLTLVCGCFFGIFPDQDIEKRESSGESSLGNRRGNSDDVIQFPYFTAVRMLWAPPNQGRVIMLKAQKLRCLLQYFLRVVPRAIQDPAGLSAEIIDFTRVSVHLPQGHDDITDQSPQELLNILATPVENINDTENLQTQDEAMLYPARCVSDTLIEDLDRHLQIDFANKFAGGGVLNSGCVQEEIRFMLSPELLVACLVFAKLESNESFVIHGTERFSSYRGYGGSFEFGGNFEDSTPLTPLPDGKLRRECVIVGIDATDYGQTRVERQYTRSHVCRDLVKAYVGFAYPEAQDATKCWPVATGNWGCGVFRGDPELKFLIQWLAASLRRREMVYVVFERDQALQKKVSPLLTLVASMKAREWDRQHAGLVRWLMAFLVEELSADPRARGESIITRAISSLEQVLAAVQQQSNKQEEPENKQKDSSPPQQQIMGTKDESPTTPKREGESVGTPAGLTKKPKTMKKELQQKSIQDFFAPKQ